MCVYSTFTCPCLEEFCNFFPAILWLVVKNLKNTRFAMRGDICFSRFSAPAYLWLQFAVAELLILAASAIIRERLLRPFYELCCWNRQLLNGSGCKNSGKAVSHWTQRILLQVLGCKLATLNLLNRFQLNCSESSWPDPVKHSACHLPDNLQSLVPSNTFDSVCVFGQKK